MPGEMLLMPLIIIFGLGPFYLPFVIVPVYVARWKKKSVPGKRPFAIAAVYATVLTLSQLLFQLIYTSDWLNRLHDAQAATSTFIIGLILNIAFVIIPLLIIAIALYAKSDLMLVIGSGVRTLGCVVFLVKYIIDILPYIGGEFGTSHYAYSMIPQILINYAPELLTWTFTLVGSILCLKKNGSGLFRNLWHMPLLIVIIPKFLTITSVSGLNELTVIFYTIAFIAEVGFWFALGWWIAHTSDPECKKIKTRAYVNAQPMYAPFEPTPAKPYYEPAQPYYNPEPAPVQNTYTAPVQNTYTEPVQSYATPVAPAQEQNTYTEPAQNYAAPVAPAQEQDTYTEPVQSYHEYASERTAEKPVGNISDSTVASLKKYKSLLDDGIISQAEFDDIKKRLLNN